MRPRWSKMKKQIVAWNTMIDALMARIAFEKETTDALIPGYAI